MGQQFGYVVNGVPAVVMLAWKVIRDGFARIQEHKLSKSFR